MKNTDNKIIVGANVHALEPIYERITHHTQNGFVKGRNFLNNIMDIDASGRLYSLRHWDKLRDEDVSHVPVHAAWDFESAFPCVNHKWIWAVLSHRKLPVNFLNLFKSIYQHARAIFRHNDATKCNQQAVEEHVLIWFLSGVLQGCPGSAFLFNNALDPFLVCMDRVLRSKRAGIVRACADDVGSSLRRLKHLGLLHPIFEKAKALGGLSLKPAKCVIIPLCEFSDEIVSEIQDWLRGISPIGQVLTLDRQQSFWVST
jgi:Reverse transcriptase (RNA-dependent DNA polymerase).